MESGPLTFSAVPLQVLPSGEIFNGAELGRATAHQGAHVNDLLPLAPGNACPIIRVGGIGEVFILLVFTLDCVLQVHERKAFLATSDKTLEGDFLGSGDDVLDHGAAGKV